MCGSVNPCLATPFSIIFDPDKGSVQSTCNKMFFECFEFAQKYSASFKDQCFDKLGLKLNASFSDSLQASLCRMITSYEKLSSGNSNYSWIETSLKCQHSLQGNNSNHRM